MLTMFGGIMDGYKKVLQDPYRYGLSIGSQYGKGVAWDVAGLTLELRKALTKAGKNPNKLNNAVNLYLEAIEKFPAAKDTFNRELRKAVGSVLKNVEKGKDLGYDYAALRFFLTLYEHDPSFRTKDTYANIDKIKDAAKKISAGIPEIWGRKGDLLYAIYLFKLENNLIGESSRYDALSEISFMYQKAAKLCDPETKKEEKMFYIVNAAWVYANDGQFLFANTMLEVEKLPRLKRIFAWEVMAKKAEDEGNIELALDCYKEALKINKTVPGEEYRKMKQEQIEKEMKRIQS